MDIVKLFFWAACVACSAAVPTPFASRTCHIDDFQLQENFSLERFMGTWYVVAHVQRTDYPYQRRSHYGLREDGSISMKTNRVMRPGDCNPWHFEARGTVNEEANNPAKLLLYPPIPNYPPEDYWVVSTDYTSYALIYSCGQQKVDGSCTARGEHAWLMGRDVGGIPQEIRAQVPAMMSALCIRPRRLNDVPLDCEEKLTRGPNHVLASSMECQEDDNGNCITDSSSHNPCAISSFQLQPDFIPEKFLGEWYEVAHTRSRTSILKLPDMRSMLFSRVDAGQDADLALLMKDIKLEGKCARVNMPGSGWLSQDNPAKITVQFPIPEKYGVRGPVEYWILSTDYLNYAVTYSCHRINEDGTCNKQREALWVLSRTPSLPGGLERRVDEAIRGACLDPVQVTENQEVCYTTDMGERNESYVPIKGRAAVTSGCDPAVAKFGCCLLNNMPATGPNFQGCPRMRPPVAGQDLEMRPISEVERRPPAPLALTADEPGKIKTDECDEKITCKMYCEYGFKRDENGCDICECAEEPQEPATSDAQEEADQETKMVSCLNQATSASKLGLPLLDCEPDGSFAQVQCHEEECWCVDRTTGYELPNTRASHDTKPDCSQDPSSTEMGSKLTSDCQSHRSAAEFALDTQEGSGHTYVPVCDEQGLYEPVQCYLDTGICWCVDALTGVWVDQILGEGAPTCAP